MDIHSRIQADYRPRIADAALQELLQAFGAVCVEGPKWCGKTWTSVFHSGSSTMLASPAGNFQQRQLAKLDPSLVLAGQTPRLIDEWQEVPEIWDAVRFEVDARADVGQFILTGSSTPQRKGVLHSGAGRIARLRMRPMSLTESGQSSAEVSLQALAEGEVQNVATGAVALETLIAAILRGGWPASQSLPLERAVTLPSAYLEAIVNDDVHRLDGTVRQSKKLWLLLRSLARNESTTASNRTLARDISAIDDASLDLGTVGTYLDIFDRLFLLDNQPPFAPNLRSSIRVKQAEKRHFVDPSIAAALLGATEEGLLNDLPTLGFLFESLVVRDLRIYAESFGATLTHYQDYADREADAVVELPDGRWVAVEVKLGAGQIDEAARHLVRLREALENDMNARPPSVLCVISGLSTAAYRREDDVVVVPITALGP